MVKINWISIAIFLLGTFLLGACNKESDKSFPLASQEFLSANILNESDVVKFAEIEIRKLTDQDVQIFWETMEGDRVFSVAYITTNDPQKVPEEFIAEFNQAVSISAKWFAQAKTNSPIMIVFAELINLPTSHGNPPLREVVVEKKQAIEWLNGNVSNEAFIDSWIIVPLPKQ